jgi:hypothetical protein
VPDDEIGAIVARLREEVDASTRGAAAGHSTRTRIAGRAEAESLWAVTADRAFATWPGWRGLLSRWGWAGLLKRAVVVPTKLVVRKLIRWYVDPPAADQRRFNELTLRMIDELTERAAVQQEQLADLRGRVEQQRDKPAP